MKKWAENKDFPSDRYSTTAGQGFPVPLRPGLSRIERGAGQGFPSVEPKSPSGLFGAGENRYNRWYDILAIKKSLHPRLHKDRES